jgi:hypothetical protein
LVGSYVVYRLRASIFNINPIFVALADGGSAWKDAFAKARDVVSKMTLEEKG